MIKSLGALAGGDPSALPKLAYTSPWDPQSPQSLLIALLPESVPLKQVDFPASSDEQGADEQGTDELSSGLSSELREFIRSECESKGWSQKEGEKDLLKVRLRLQDDLCGSLALPANTAGADTKWIDGCVRVLQCWRGFGGAASLREFESSKNAEKFFQELAWTRPRGWVLRQRLEFLLLPYCRYTDRIDLAKQYVLEQPFRDLIGAAPFPELANEVLSRCLKEPLGMHSEVSTLCDVVKPAEGSDCASLRTKLQQLTKVAKMISAPSFGVLVEWASSDHETQRDVLRRTLQNPKHVTPNELKALRSSVFSSLDDKAFSEECIRAALQRQRFMLLKSLDIGENKQFFKSEVLRQIQHIISQPSKSGNQLSSVLAMLDAAVDLSPSEEFKQVLRHYTQLNAILSAYPGVGLQFLVEQPELRARVQKVLEVDRQAYLHYTQLRKVFGITDADAEGITELCVESALANDDFDAASEYFERGFITNKSSGAWLACFQTARYMSPQWEKRPLPVLKLQVQYMARCLTLCPPGDLMPVLDAWKKLEAELHEREGQQATNTAQREAPPPTPTDNLSSLLVSGLGWAIGANPRAP